MYKSVEYPLQASGDLSQSGEETHKIPIDYGQILEKVIRNDKMSISEISRKMNVSRRTLYNWFESKDLDCDVFKRIGLIINHDFTKDLPKDYMTPDYRDLNAQASVDNNSMKSPDAIYYWMDKYIRLLEKFNELLID